MLILNLILFLSLIGLLYWLVSLIPMPHPFPLIIQVLVVVLAVLSILSALFGVSLLGVTVPSLI